jgi:hypothetical protein
LKRLGVEAAMLDVLGLLVAVLPVQRLDEPEASEGLPGGDGVSQRLFGLLVPL